MKFLTRFLILSAFLACNAFAGAPIDSPHFTGTPDFGPGAKAAFQGAFDITSFQGDPLYSGNSFNLKNWQQGLTGQMTFSDSNLTLPAGTSIALQTGNLSTARTITLPAANSVAAGWPITIVDRSGTASAAHDLIAAAAGADTINGASTLIAVTTPYGARTFRSDGTSKWTTDASLDSFASNPTYSPLWNLAYWMGTLNPGYRASDIDHTLTSTNSYFNETGALTATRTITLPAASTMTSGRRIVISDLSGSLSASHYLHIVPTGSDTINGAASIDLKTPYSVVTLVADVTAGWAISNGVDSLAADPTSNGSFSQAKWSDAVMRPLPQTKIGVTTPRTIVLCNVGDSLTSASGSTGSTGCWPYQLIHNFGLLGGISSYHNAAVSGRTIDQMITGYPTEITPYKPTGNQIGILTVLGGTNNMASDSAATMLSKLETLWADGRTDGFVVVAFTVPVNASWSAVNDANEAKRKALNDLIRADFANYDYLVDLDQIWNVPGVSDSVTGTPYFSDGTHPTALGNSKIAQLVYDVVFRERLGTGSLLSTIPRYQWQPYFAAGFNPTFFPDMANYPGYWLPLGGLIEESVSGYQGTQWVTNLVRQYGGNWVQLDTSKASWRVALLGGSTGNYFAVSYIAAGANTNTEAQLFAVSPSGDVTASKGNFAIGTAGKTISIKSGTNALAGTVTLSNGTATITSTAIDSNTAFATPTLKTASGTPSTKIMVSVTSGSATVTGEAGDNSTYNWVAFKVN